MAKYHFKCGNFVDGPVCFIAVVEAVSDREAVKLLKKALPQKQRINLEHTEGISCIELQFNKYAIGTDDIVDTVPDQEEASKCPPPIGYQLVSVYQFKNLDCTGEMRLTTKMLTQVTQVHLSFEERWGVLGDAVLPFFLGKCYWACWKKKRWPIIWHTDEDGKSEWRLLAPPDTVIAELD